MDSTESQNLSSQYRDCEKQFEILLKKLFDADNERHLVHAKISELYVYPLPGMGNIFNFSISPEIIDHDTYQKLTKELVHINSEYLNLVNLCNDAFTEFKKMQRNTSIRDLADAYNLVNW